MRLSAAERTQLGLVGDSFSDESVLRALTAAGATKEQAALLWSIGYEESGYVTGAENRNNKDGSIDRGPWQINSKAWPDITPAQAHRLDSAAAGAMRIFRAQGATAWVAFDRNKYNVLQRALKAPWPKEANAGGRVPPQSQRTPGVAFNVAPVGATDPVPAIVQGILRQAPPGSVYRPGDGVYDPDGKRLYNDAPVSNDPTDPNSVQGGFPAEEAARSADNAISSVAGAVGDLAGTFANLAGKVTNVEFWRRAGIVVLAGVVGITGVVLVVKG